MRIHGIFYILVGILVTVISSFIEKFTVFIAVGILFMFIGLSKLVVGKSKSDVKVETKLKNSVQNTNKNKEKYITCPHCKAYNFPSSEFCHHCGRKIK
jgi:cadmium resistance protein CadD (predicted permease)